MAIESNKNINKKRKNLMIYILAAFAFLFLVGYSIPILRSICGDELNTTLAFFIIQKAETFSSPVERILIIDYDVRTIGYEETSTSLCEYNDAEGNIRTSKQFSAVVDGYSLFGIKVKSIVVACTSSGVYEIE